MKTERFIYHWLSIVISFCATSAILHVWLYATLRWLVTYLAIAVFSLLIRQVIYGQMVGKALREIGVRL